MFFSQVYGQVRLYTSAGVGNLSVERDRVGGSVQSVLTLTVASTWALALAWGGWRGFPLEPAAVPFLMTLLI